MEYSMEELVPIVAELAGKFTSGDSTSITYERAEQLMEAVIYCIQEGEKYAGENAGESMGTEHRTVREITPTEHPSAKTAYRHGYQCVIDKVQTARTLYHRILESFEDYGNTCLHDTFVKGIPQFFKWYDVKFDPQNTILTLDYPVLMPVYNECGIDAIYKFLLCIEVEQHFLHTIESDFVQTMLRRYCKQPKDMIENLCQIVWQDILLYTMAGKNLGEELTEQEKEQIRMTCRTLGQEDTGKKLNSLTDTFVEKYADGDEAVKIYLYGATRDMAVRLCCQ